MMENVLAGTAVVDVEPVGSARLRRWPPIDHVNGEMTRMRRGIKLAAVAVIAALLPVAGANADEAYARFELVREITISGQVKHLETGKTGTMSLVVRSRQGIDGRKIPTGSGDPGGIEYQPYVGLPNSTAGLARYDGCVTVIIAGITSEKNQCRMLDAQITTDPAMNEATFVATIAENDDDWGISVTAKIEANSQPVVTDPGSTVTPKYVDRTGVCTKSVQEYDAGLYVPTGSKDTLDLVCLTARLDALVGRQAERSGIVRIGNVFDERPMIGMMAMLPATFTASLRTRVELAGYVDRARVVCLSSAYVVLPVGCYG